MLEHKECTKRTRTLVDCHLSTGGFSEEDPLSFFLVVNLILQKEPPCLYLQNYAWVLL